MYTFVSLASRTLSKTHRSSSGQTSQTNSGTQGTGVFQLNSTQKLQRAHLTHPYTQYTHTFTHTYTVICTSTQNTDTHTRNAHTLWNILRVHATRLRYFSTLEYHTSYIIHHIIHHTSYITHHTSYIISYIIHHALTEYQKTQTNTDHSNNTATEPSHRHTHRYTVDTVFFSLSICTQTPDISSKTRESEEKTEQKTKAKSESLFISSVLQISWRIFQCCQTQCSCQTLFELIAIFRTVKHNFIYLQYFKTCAILLIQSKNLMWSPGSCCKRPKPPINLTYLFFPFTWTSHYYEFVQALSLIPLAMLDMVFFFFKTLILKLNWSLIINTIDCCNNGLIRHVHRLFHAVLLVPLQTSKLSKVMM